MKKQITIFQENNVPITMVDDDERTLEDCAKSLSGFMSLNNISILETSESVAIMRPGKITSILVDKLELLEPNEGVKKPKIKIPGKKKPIKKKEKRVDIITDVD